MPPPRSLGTLSAKVVEDWRVFIGPSLTIIGTLVGAMLLRWVLHRAIDRIIGSAMTRAASHASQTPRRARRILPRPPC